MSETLNNDMVKIIANPQLIIKQSSIVKLDVSYADDLQKLLQIKYKDIYLNSHLMKAIINAIDDTIQKAKADREIQSCVDSLVDACIAENTFSFAPKR
tara:strand:+ start:243 stop:536 length:294 start_codon:yes stop_codon:yes gene_type:complete